MNDITLEKLIETFTKHAEKYEEKNQKSKDNFTMYFPDEEFPEWMQTDFNLPSALKYLCEEIKAIKEKIDIK